MECLWHLVVLGDHETGDSFLAMTGVTSVADIGSSIFELFVRYRRCYTPLTVI